MCMVRIIVKTIEGTNSGATLSTLQSVVAAYSDIGPALSPLHPGTRDPALSTYFYLDVPDRVVQEVVDSLRAVDGIDGAYVKPQEELP